MGGSVSGQWTDDCESSVSGRGYVRYYSFSVATDAEVTINLVSSVNTYLYLRQGSETSGPVLHENDDVGSGNTNSRIVATLSTGSYTVEATTNSASASGSFSLTITVEDLLNVNVSRAAGSEDAQVRPSSPVSLTATFSRLVFGFAMEDITVVNGEAGNLVGSDGDAIYTFEVTPNAIGEVTVDIAAGVATDGGGSGNTAAPRLFLGIPYDFDGNGGISKSEAIEAIFDYFANKITKAQTIAVIVRYFSPPTEPGPGLSGNCIQTVSSDGPVIGQWASGCDSEVRSG